MSAGSLFKRRLGQYGAAWVAAFLLVLIGALGAVTVFHLDPIRVADVLLPAAFAVLGLALAVFVVRTLMAAVSLWAKLALLALGTALALPLLWSPVLAILVCAAVSHVAIEYSSAYAEFRIIVSQMIYPPTALVFRGSVIESVWNGFQVVATLVGFVAAVTQLWPMMLRAVRGERAA
jgi:hypothetical protein